MQFSRMSENKSKCGLVSIGIPAYNRPSSLDKILGLITSQSYTKLEIIISAVSSSKWIRAISSSFDKSTR